MPMATWFRKTLFFNQASRDIWVEQQARGISAGARVLDVGAGSCPYRAMFNHCVYRTHDFEKLKPEQLRGHSGYGTVDYVGDICSIPVEDASFDVILCTEVLEHVPEPIRAIQEFARILKPGGKVLLTAPLGSGLHQEPYHYYGGYTPHWYRRFLGDAGFDNINIEPNGKFYSFYGQECMRFLDMGAPWKNVSQLCYAPVWCLGLLWSLTIQLLAKQLDKLDHDNAFTVGYHVMARRTRADFRPK
jgi:ubiquinone/menaquinone biosynthesis C-methylase UbiE